MGQFGQVCMNESIVVTLWPQAGAGAQEADCSGVPLPALPPATTARRSPPLPGPANQISSRDHKTSVDSQDHQHCQGMIKKY